jgi:hypothetical protein
MSDQDPPLSNAFLTYMEGFKLSINSSIHNEVTAAVAPFREKQKEIIEDLKDTQNRVSDIEADNKQTKENVEELQKQMASMQEKLSANPTNHLPGSVWNTGSTSHPPPIPPPAPDAPPAEVVEVLRAAKKILGFSPITIDDINYLKEHHSIADNDYVMNLSIQEFLHYEMKIPSSITSKLAIKRVFPPAKQHTGWTTLYAEFQDTATTDLIQGYVTNLLPGKTVSIYVPHSLQPRFRAVNNIAHGLRNGTVKHKTKVKYGASDFVLLVKPKGQPAPWTYASLSSLPPFQLSLFDGNSSSSPPPGRQRLTSKRARPESAEKTDRPTSKSRRNDPNDETAKEDFASVDEKGQETVSKSPLRSTPVLPSSQQSLLKTPSKAETVAIARMDLGSFQPSACVSPSATKNMNFTFGHAKSSIPKPYLNC